MKDSEQRTMVSESPWMRVYKDSAGEYQYESKFLLDGLTVTSDSLEDQWKTFSQREKYDFAQAFQAKSELTEEDEKILNFLMRVGDHTIWLAISPLLARHRDRQRVLQFVADRISSSETPKGNFYQLTQSLGDRRILPVLRDAYAGYRRVLEQGAFANKVDYLDYLLCVKALLTTDGGSEYKDTLFQYVSFPDEQVARWATWLVRDP